jgi:hypothetical protein
MFLCAALAAQNECWRSLLQRLRIEPPDFPIPLDATWVYEAAEHLRLEYREAEDEEDPGTVLRRLAGLQVQ